VTFAAESGLASSWDVPVTVRVFGAAQSPHRPACAFGKRSCAALASSRRVETATHSAASADPRWDLPSGDGSGGDDASAVRVFVSPELDAVDAPRIASGRFSNLLNGKRGGTEDTFEKERVTCMCAFTGSHATLFLLLHSRSGHHL
jgi:hypothetical protein